MKVGALSTAVTHYEPDAGLGVLHALGVRAIEIVCGGYLPRYWDPERLLADPDELSRWRDRIASHELTISAFALHGDPLSPVGEVAADYSRLFRQVCRLAEKLGVERLTLLAGLPAGAPGDSAPCWITTPFPPANEQIYSWQWDERLIPYWQEHGAIATDHGCRLCFEMTAGDMLFHPDALVRFREAVGPVAGCNFDPSHLFWQGIDPLEALHYLGDAVYHVHAKDTRLELRNVRLNGVLDPRPFRALADRAWTFRTIGYGHDELFWRDFVSTLRAIGYDDVLSVEHEDDYMDMDEGLERAVALLRSIVIERPAGRHWWD